MTMIVINLVAATIVDLTTCYPSVLLKPQKEKTKATVHYLVVVAAVSVLLFYCIFLMNNDNDK